MYTTNAIESINLNFRKVTKKESFTNENALFKSLYLRIKELEEKWSKGHINNWLIVINRLMIDDSFKNRIKKIFYINNSNLNKNTKKDKVTKIKNSLSGNKKKVV